MTTRNVLTQFRRPALFALLAAVLLVLSGCGATTTDATTNGGAEASGPVDASSFHGTWTRPANTDCATTVTGHEFEANGADETSGAYTMTFASGASDSGTWTFQNESLETVVNVDGNQVEDTWDWEFSEDRSELTLFVIPDGAVCTFFREDG